MGHNTILNLKKFSKDFSMYKVLNIEHNQKTPLEYEFSNLMKNVLRAYSIELLKYSNIRKKLSFPEIFKVCVVYLFLNLHFLYRKVFSLLVGHVNSFFGTRFVTHETYFKFPIVYPLWNDKYLVDNTTTIVFTGEPEIDFTTKLFKLRKTIMIKQVASKDLLNEDPVFQHNFNLDHVLKGFFSWIGLSEDRKFRIYSINGCSAIYDWDELPNIELDMLCKFFIKPKPPRHTDFKTKVGVINYPYHKLTDYFANMSRILTDKGLFVVKRKISYLGCNTLTFLAQKFLNNRNGMSYGFIAFQTPIKLNRVFPVLEPNFSDRYGFFRDRFYFKCNGKYYDFKLPPIHIVTTRSGCDKSNINPKKDILVYEINDSKILQIIPSAGIDFQPSFDIWIIITQSICNTIICNVLNFLNEDHQYIKNMSSGLAIVHVHAFPHKKSVPDNVLIFGENNPAISCGCLESSYYCFKNQLDKFFDNLDCYKNSYGGGLFLEKDHGVVFSTHHREDRGDLKEIFSNYVYGVNNFKSFL